MDGGEKKIYHSKSKTFLILCFCFILGVGIFSSQIMNKNGQFFAYLAFLTVAILLVFVWNNLKFRFWSSCLLFFIAGVLRFFLSIPDNSPDKINYYNGRQVVFYGQIWQEVNSRVYGNQVVVNASIIKDKAVSGRVLINLPLYIDLNFGDSVKVSCDLEKPKGTKNFSNYDKYLAGKGVWSVCDYAALVEKVPSNNSAIQKSYINFFSFKKNLQSMVERVWPEPASSLVAGVLYGARSGFSDEVSEDFNMSGITHIVAVSGYNISIIVSVLMGVLLRAGINRRKAFFGVVAGIAAFVLFTGASASVVRAGVMGIVVLLATYLGRRSRVGNVLVFTAVVMLLFNPFTLVWDVGFQLSFLSTLGLIYISPIINNFGLENKNAFRQIFIESFVATISATIATVALISFQFGRVSLIAPITNLLVLWVIPFLMLVGTLAIIFSHIYYPFGLIVAFPAYFGLKYVIITAHGLAALPYASVDFTLPLWAVGIFYILLFVYVKNKNTEIGAGV